MPFVHIRHFQVVELVPHPDQCLSPARIRAVIERKLNHNLSQHTSIVIDGRRLNDDALIPAAALQGDLGVKFLTSSGDYRVFLKTSTSEYTLIPITWLEKVKDLKQAITERTDLPPEAQRLTFNSKDMEDVETMADLVVWEGSIVHLTFPVDPQTQI